LECGTQYRYDWAKMRRTVRLEHPENLVVSDTTKKPPRKCSGLTPAGHGERASQAWRPRERRLRCDTPILLRAANGTEWLHGGTENISRSGLLFHADKEFPVGTALELILEMPAEISGSAGAKVICQAKVARVIPGMDGHASHTAVTIGEYHFLPAGQVSGL